MYRNNERPDLLLSETAELAALNEVGIVEVTAATRRWFQQSVKMLQDEIGDLRVVRLTPKMVHEWHVAMGRRTKAVTANSYLRGVSTVLGRLERMGIINVNVCSYVPRAKEPPARPRAVSWQTYQAMRAAADNARDLCILDLLWSTGCRVGGLISMRLPAIEFWHDDRERLCAALMVTEKYGESRFVYAGSPASQSLEEWIAERPKTDHDQLFVSLGGRSYGHPLCLISIQHVMRKLRTQAGIAKDTPAHAHGFRHAFAIRMLDHGHDLAAVAAWLGHADPAFTAKVYVRRREDELRRKFFGG